MATSWIISCNSKQGGISVCSPDLPTAPQSFPLCNSHPDAQQVNKYSQKKTAEVGHC